MRIIHAPSFDKDLKRLRKKYPRIDNDLEDFGKVAALDHERAGDAVPGFGGLIWKYRSKSTDMNKGARDGYRIIGYLDSEKLYLLTMYYKGAKADISNNEIYLLIHKFIGE